LDVIQEAQKTATILLDLFTPDHCYTPSNLPGALLHASELMPQERISALFLVWPQYEPLSNLLTTFTELFHKGTSLVETNFFQTRVVQFLCIWIDTHVSDFDDPLLFSTLQGFIRTMSKVPSTEALAKLMAKTFLNSLSTLKAERKGYQGVAEVVISPALLTCKDVSFLTLLDFDSGEIARQLTLLTHKIMIKIPMTQFLDQSFLTKEGTPHFFELAHWINTISIWIGNEVTLAVNIKIRVAIVVKFIALASEFRRHHNWHCMIAVIAGLSQFSIRRLSQTWKAVPTQSMNTFRTLSGLASPKMNFREIRQHFETAPHGALPLVTLLKDLIHIGEYPNKNDQNHISLEKLDSLGPILYRFVLSKKTVYKFVEVDVIQRFLRSVFESVLPEQVDNLHEIIEKRSIRLEASML